MTRLSFARYVLIPFAFLSLFLFPYPATILPSFLASVFVPWLAIVVGIVADLLYRVGSVSSLPIGTIFGAIVSVCALLVRRFIKARIIVE